jgi:signal transduction histidine kinase
MDRVGRLWIGTYGDALWLVENEVARHVPREQSGGHNVLALFEDSRGQVWVSGGGSVARFDGTNFHAFGREQGVPGAAASFAEGASGVIWLSTGSGVFRQESERKFTEVRVGERSIAGIGCLKSDPNGSMWLGSSDRGLLRWKDGRLAAVDAGAGFPVNTVHSVVEDGSGFFWMTSSRSIVRAHGSDLHAVADGTKARLVCQEFDASDGLPRAEFTSGRQPVSARDGQGRLWFATTKGVVMTDPARLQLNDVPPPVHIEALVYHKPLKNGKGRESSARFNTENGSPNGAPRGLGASEVRLTTPFANPLRLPAGSGRIEIHYTATSLTAPERVRFQVKLEGHDPGWQDAPDRRVTYYHEPPPGRHSFHVRAANNDGLWNESGTSLAFSVLPFFWQTWWFRLVVIAALINLGGAAAWWRSRKKHNRELEELERSRRHQAELAHFGRVSTMGQLASSLAHELNQPLGAILRNAEAAELFLQSNPPDLEEVRAILADIRHDDRRAGDVIDRMRALLKRREFQASRLDVNDLVSEVAALVRPDAEARRMSLIIQPASTPAMVWADRVQLQQVLLNLLINAMDAMHDCPPEKRSALVQVRPVLDGVELAISDTGHGISEVNLKHLFDSFFTTKSNGLGMGLAISQTIVAAHGGRITAQNNEYGGATFRFTLSATAKPGSKL